MIFSRQHNQQSSRRTSNRTDTGNLDGKYNLVRTFITYPEEKSSEQLSKRKQSEQKTRKTTFEADPAGKLNSKTRTQQFQNLLI